MAFWRIPNLRRRLLLKQRVTFGAVLVVSFIGFLLFLAAPVQERHYTDVIVHDDCVQCISTTKTTIENTIIKQTEEVITPSVEPRVEHDSWTSVGSLNVHMWSELCGAKVDTLRNWPHFPFFPDKRSFISKFYKTQAPPSSNNGERIFGFLHPPKSGQYKFAITSDNTSELWLSPNEDPASSEMIARVYHVYASNGSAWTEKGDYKKYPEQISKEITLQADKKYYIESLSKQGTGAAHVAVYWSYKNSTFEIISSKYLSIFTANNSDEFIPPHAGKQTNSLLRKNSSFYFNRLPVIDRNEYINLFPSCPYNPSFLVRTKLERFDGAAMWLAHESYVYPQDDTDMNSDRKMIPNRTKSDTVKFRKVTFISNKVKPKIHADPTKLAGNILNIKESVQADPNKLAGNILNNKESVQSVIFQVLRSFKNSVFRDDKREKPDWTKPNIVADKKRVKSVVQKFMDSLRSRSRKYSLKKIHKVIHKPDPKNGDRFLLNLELGLDNTNQSFRLSEHVYVQKGNDTLCLPGGMNWNNNATVYFILPVKDQGKWVHYFIKQLTEASLLTGDTNFHVIIVDFMSKDIDMWKAFNTSLLRSRHTIISLMGRFYKTFALNVAALLVPNAHDIVFLFDLHIDVPADIMDSVRMNTIAGRMAYFPLVGRLDCDSSSVKHQGYWEMWGYGVMSIYKSDWDRLGGMNIKDFKYKWGGEDSDLLDRVLMLPMEAERIRHPGLYHHHHSKHKMWN